MKKDGTQKTRKGWKVQQVEEVVQGGETLHVAKAAEGTGTIDMSDSRQKDKETKGKVEDEVNKKLYE